MEGDWDPPKRVFIFASQSPRAKYFTSTNCKARGSSVFPKVSKAKVDVKASSLAQAAGPSRICLQMQLGFAFAELKGPH